MHSAEFFEVSDRPTNLDYCPPRQRVHMHEVIEGLRAYLAEEWETDEEEEAAEEQMGSGNAHAPHHNRRTSLLPEF